MKPVASKLRTLTPSTKVKTKLNSQGELLKTSKPDGIQSQARTPDLMRKMDLKALQTNQENKIDIYRTIQTRPSILPTKDKPPTNLKIEFDLMRKKKTESFVAPSPRQQLRSKRNTQETTNDSSGLSERIFVRSKLANEPTEKKSKNTYAKMESQSSRGNSKLANNTLHESVNYNPIKETVAKLVETKPFWEFKKTISDEDVLLDEHEPEKEILAKEIQAKEIISKKLNNEFSLCSKHFLGSPKLMPVNMLESRTNSFCELPSKQSITSFQNHNSDFVHSFRGVVTLPETSMQMNTKVVFPPPHAFEKYSELRKQNDKNMSEFFVPDKEPAEGIVNDDKIEVVLHSKQRPKVIRSVVRDFSSTYNKANENVFNNEFELDVISQQKRSLQSSQNDSNNKSSSDCMRFDTFKTRVQREVTMIPIFTKPAKIPTSKFITVCYQFVNPTKNLADNNGTHFEDQVLSARVNCQTLTTDLFFNSSKKLTDRKQDTDSYRESSSKSIKKRASMSSLEFICQKCRTPFSKNSEKMFLNKHSTEDLNFSEKHLGDSRSQNLKRTNLLLINNDSSESQSLNRDDLVQRDFNKTNSGKLNLILPRVCKPGQENSDRIEEESLNTSGLFKIESKLTPRSRPNPMTLSTTSMNTNSPQKYLGSIFKKIVVFNSKWEKVKETIFLQNPDIVQKIVLSFTEGVSGKVSWNPLDNFFQKWKLNLQKQQLAKLIMYVQGFLTVKGTPFASISNFNFFNFLLTPKFLFSPTDTLSKDAVSAYENQIEFSRDEIEAINSVFEILVHKINHFGILFKTLDSDFIRTMFESLSPEGLAVKQEQIVSMINRNDDQIKSEDVGFVMEEFRAGSSGITWQCFSDYFEQRIWKV